MQGGFESIQTGISTEEGHVQTNKEDASNKGA